MAIQSTKGKTVGQKSVKKKPGVKKGAKKNIHYAAKTKKHTGKLEGFTDLLSKLEVEAEKIVRQFIARAEEASTELRDSIEDVLDKVRGNGFYTLASDKKDDAGREIRRLVEEVVDRAKEIELLPLNAVNRDKIIQEAKKNLEELRGRLRADEWIARARVSASNAKDNVLSILSIPSQDEIEKLQKKLVSLEKRVNSLNKKAA